MNIVCLIDMYTMDSVKIYRHIMLFNYFMSIYNENILIYILFIKK